jgi:inorganic pyrophosphatase
VVEAEQTERDGETTRNDRLIAVAAKSHAHAKVRSLAGLSETLLDEIEHFFVSYNNFKGKDFNPLGRHGPKSAREVVEEGVKRFRREKTRRSSAKKKAK